MPSSWELPAPANPSTGGAPTDLQATRRVAADVLMVHTPDGGEIVLENGGPRMSDGLFNAVYLSLFGGNEEDSGLEGDKPLQWWGNWSERKPGRRYRSETQYLMRSLPAVPVNLRKLEDAVGRDLQWLVDEKIATAVSALATIPGLNRVSVSVNIEIGLTVYKFNFTDSPMGAAA